MNRIISFLVILWLAVSCGQDKPETFADRVQQHINYLASDELKGRATGTEGEIMAASYIKERFEENGLQPLGGNDSFYQEFDFLATRKLTANNSLRLDDSEIADSLYFPLNFSGNGNVNGDMLDLAFGIEASEINYSDYNGKDANGKILMVSISSPDGIHPHSKYLPYHDLKIRARKAQEKGAAGVIFYNNDPTAADPEQNYNQKIAALDIPVLFIKDHTLISSNTASMQIELAEDNRTGRNVVGWLDNGATNYVVFGAHYDHLGYGQSGGSLYRGEEEMIHNGADDNASGTAMVIELSRALADGPKDRNYVFMAYSGEELGLLGSKFFVENATYDITNTSFMFNMDMVGRLDSTSNAMSVMGTGTSPSWDSLINISNTSGLELTQSESGVGPSDYTSFYLVDIPVLGFFTGTHEDYHKPTDDSEKINVSGMEKIFNLILNLNSNVVGTEKLAFSKTQDSNARSAPRFTVTLGVVPDYIYNGKGLKLDGVSEGKPGQEAGLQKGDIIIKMGTIDIDDIYAYMGALGQFKKGDKIVVEILRDEESMSFEVQF